MNLYVIKNESFSLTNGEKKVLSKLKELYDEERTLAYLFVQPKVGSMRPDFILLDEKRGLAILEVKDWSSNYILSVDQLNVELEDRSEENPFYKMDDYISIIKVCMTGNDSLRVARQNIFSIVVFTNLSMKNIEERDFSNEFLDNDAKCITSKELTILELGDIFTKKLRGEMNIEMLRSALFPEVKIPVLEKVVDEKDLTQRLKTLDEKQEQIARKHIYGHFMVTGVPGSGKSVILMSRALHLIKENPTWKILILTYNRPLKNKLQNALNSTAKDIKDNVAQKDINVKNIRIMGFHQLTNQLGNDLLEKSKYENNGSLDEWYENDATLVMDRAEATYDAILIDEYQDFKTDWIKLCLKLGKPYKRINSNKEEVEGINLFLAGDRLQSIFHDKDVSWKALGIDMRGRSELLKVAYRNAKSHTKLALDFLNSDSKMQKEVEKFYKDEETGEVNVENINNKGDIKFIPGNVSGINNTIDELLKEYDYKDILVLTPYTNQVNKFFAQLKPEHLRMSTKIDQKRDDETENRLVVGTCASAKGIEAKVVILLNADSFKKHFNKEKDSLNRKLLYVAMTRASEKLYIHASNFNTDTFAKTLKSLSK